MYDDLPLLAQRWKEIAASISDEERAKFITECFAHAREEFDKLYPLAREAYSNTDKRGYVPMPPAEAQWERIRLLLGILGWATDLVSNVEIVVRDGGGIALPEADAKAFAASTALLMQKATVYWWRASIWSDLIRDTAPLPKFTINPSLFPHPLMWWTLETDFHVVDRDEEWSVLGHFINILAPRPQMTVVLLNMKSGVLELQSGMIGSWGQEVTDSGKSLMAAELVYRALAFIASPYLDKEQHRMARPARRRFERIIGTEPEPVYVVTLRRPIPEADRFGTGGQREWYHRWLVRGHYRNQWYPSLRDHKLIWVPPYMKGPQDKPLLEHLYVVRR